MPAQGFPLLQGGVLRGLAATSPLLLAQDASHLQLGVSLSGYATTAALNSTDQALAALTVEVVGKQDTLSAGTGLVFHERLLEANTVKSLVAGANVTHSSTGEFVSISAEGRAPSRW
jgi:hypothetical protein